VVDPGDDDYIVITFDGRFENTKLLWRATIRALGMGRRSYIDVTDISQGQGNVEVGLPVDKIDVPTIKKTIVMMRQYKNLRLGRHEFGLLENTD